MTFHYDSLKDFIALAPEEVNTQAKPDMLSYLHHALAFGAYYHLPFSSTELFDQPHYSKEKIIDLTLDYSNQSLLEGILFPTPTPIVLVEDTQSLIIFDQEKEYIRSSMFLIAKEFVSLGSARLEFIEHDKEKNVLFRIKQPIYANVWKNAVPINHQLPSHLPQTMGYDLVNATVSCMEELAYLKNEGSLVR